MDTLSDTTQQLLDNWQSAILIVFIFAWIIAAALSFAVGANDCANSFGTAVGSGTLTLRQACYLAAFFETFGAVFMSAMVGNTIRKGIFDTDSFSSFKPEYAKSWVERKECSNNYSYSHEHYINEVFCPSQVSKGGYTNQKKCTFPYAEKGLSAQMDKINRYSRNESIPEDFYTCNAYTETAYEINYPSQYNNLDEYRTLESQREIQRPDLELVYIHFASMIASASWQLFATSFSLPVSGTHSIIGALVGGALASSAGHKAVTWSKIGGIVLSWVTSPTLSCIAAYFIYRYIGSNIIQSNDPILAARRSFPVFMGICMFLNGYALVLIQLKPCQPTDLDFICNWPTQEFTESIGIGYSYRKYICSLVYAVPFGLLIWFLAKVFAMPFYEKKDQELLNSLEIPEKFSKTLSSERLLSDTLNNNSFTPNNMKMKPIQSLVKIEEEEDSIIKDSLEDSESDPKVFSSETHAEPDARTNKNSVSKKDSVVSRTDSFRVNLLQKQLSEKRDSDAEKPVPNSPVKLGRFVVNSVDPNTPRKIRQPSYKAKSNFLHDLTVQTLRPAALKYHKSVDDMYLAGEDVNYFSYPFRQGNHAHNLRANQSHHTALGAEHGDTSNPALSPKKRTGSTSGVFRTLSHKLLPKHGRTRHVSDSVAHHHPNNIAHNNPIGRDHIVTPQSLSTRNSGNNLPEMNNSLPANGLSRNASSFDQKSHLRKIQESESDNFTDVEHEECAQNPLAYRMKETKSALKVSPVGGVTPQAGGMFTMGGADEECESREFISGDHESDTHQLTGHSIGHSEVAKTARFDIEKNETVQYVNKVGLVVESYFKRLQVLAACCSSLAHGGNDTANAIAPLIGIFLLFVYGPIANDEKVTSNQWLFAFGGLFMSLGLFCLGRRCIETMGEGITEVVPSSGFTTSMVAVLTVQISTICGMPVSSTHCQVGAVIGIGLISGWRSVKWSLMKNVALAWILTLPATGLISYVIVKILVYFSPGFY